jgi:hypothetical protein
MRNIIIVFCLVGMITGCATARPQLTRDEWLAVTSRNYEGVTKEQAIGAAERLFRLADSKKFKIVYTEDGIYAARNWMDYLVFTVITGTDYWLFKVTPTVNGVKASVQVNTQAQGLMPIPTTNGAWTATTSPMAGMPVDGTAIFDVFWARMDYLLGKRTDWMDCKMADQRIKEGIVWGNNEPLCNSFNINDDNPTIQKVEQNQKQKLPNDKYK